MTATIIALLNRTLILLLPLSPFFFFEFNTQCMVCILDITVDKLKILSLCLDHETLIVQGIITPFMGQQ